MWGWLRRRGRMMSPLPWSTLGLGWRPEIAGLLTALPGLRFCEVIAESLHGAAPPPALAALRDRGVTVIPHGISLSLGGAELPDRKRLAHLAACARRLRAPLVSEHIAFVRAGGIETGHLLPVPRTRASLSLRTAQRPSTATGWGEAAGAKPALRPVLHQRKS